MKKAFFIVAFIAISFTISAQDREDSTPEKLSYKSETLLNAKYWLKNSKTGKWENHKNTERPYYGEGVQSDNFNLIFIGEYANYRYLFLDIWLGQYKYPTLEQEWTYYDFLYAGLLTDSVYNSLDNIKDGEIISIKPDYYSEIFRGITDYSFPSFLQTTELLRSTDETLYNSYKSTNGVKYAEFKHKESYPQITLITLKRTKSNGDDVIRFRVYPKADVDLIDYEYFEIPYKEYRKLFTPDKKYK